MYNKWENDSASFYKSEWKKNVDKFFFLFMLIFCRRYIYLELTIVLGIVLAASAAQYHIRLPSSDSSSGFVPSLQESNEDQTPSATVNYRQQQSYEYEEDEEEPQQVTPANRRQQQAYIRPSYNNNQAPNNINVNTNKNNKKFADEELEVEEPDRLALLLEKSSFNCEGRTG